MTYRARATTCAGGCCDLTGAKPLTSDRIDERRRIVDYLRRGASFLSPEHRKTLEQAIDAIERGVHDA